MLGPLFLLPSHGHQSDLIIPPSPLPDRRLFAILDTSIFYFPFPLSLAAIPIIHLLWHSIPLHTNQKLQGSLSYPQAILRVLVPKHFMSVSFGLTFLPFSVVGVGIVCVLGCYCGLSVGDREHGPPGCIFCTHVLTCRHGDGGDGCVR